MHEPPPPLLPQLFARAAVCHSTKLALRAADRPLTYSELDARSRRFASELASRGIGPESLVGVALARRSTLLVALLGIVRAGAAYLPLDPGHPADRLRYMLEDSAAVLLVADDPELCTRLGVGDLPTISSTAGQDRAATTWADGVAEARVSDGTLAYVIYTSGSTGRPKGVEIPHGALANLLASMQETPGMSADDRVLAITTLSFDIAVAELWLPLVTGATVVLLDRDAAMDGARLVSVIRDERITVVQATPTTWSMLLAAGWRDGRGIRALSGGEPLPRDLATAIQRTGADLWNMYGPTETTVWSTHWHVAEGPVAIGGPVANTTLHVLDDEMQPVAAGVTGELYIGGAGMARGYRNRPDLTVERFLPDPFSTVPGARLYRTGDLARTGPDGMLECLGRADNQVKVDGFRIEPGEIEAVLRTAPAVRDAVVVAVEVGEQDRRLVAYLTGDEHGVGPAELRALAARHLPEYMIPVAFVHLHALPLTSSGKVDRRALPPPDFSVRPDGMEYVPPLTATERALAEVWREVLGLERIGIQDNFFDIGGRSRLGARLFAIIAERFGRVLPLATLFEAPTIAALAERLDSTRADERGCSSMVPIQQGSAAMLPFFCMHPVGGHVVSYRELVQRLGPDVPFYGLQSAGLDGRTPPVDSIEEMADRYLLEIRRVQPEGPYRLGGASFGGLVAYEMARRLRAAGDQVALLAMLDTEYPPVARLFPVRQLARFRFFRTHVYPGLRRVLSQGVALQQMGPAGYLGYVRQRLWPAADAPDLRGEEERDDRPLGGSDAFTRAVHRVVAANYRAMANYIPQPYDGAITYFRARDAQFTLDLRHLWETVARRVDVHEVPGTHFAIRREPEVQVLASILREYLLRASDRSGEGSTLGPPRQSLQSTRATA